MKKKIILNLAISLDGFIADHDGGFAWIQPSGDNRLNTDRIWSHQQFLEQISAIVMGRRSYEQQLHTEYGNKQIYVVTSTQREDEGNVHFIGKDLCREVIALKEEARGDIYLFGGGLSIDLLLKAGLIDEYIIGVIPMILGKGIPLFLHDHPAIPLKLTDYYVEDGIVILRYIPRQSKNDEHAVQNEEEQKQ